MIDLDRYFQRIGYEGSREPTLETLRGVHDAHALAVPFENLDVQLRIPLNTDASQAYDKIVVAGRGGWCYEQNGLLGAALESIGFDVVRVAAGVMMHERGEDAFANHLCLLVRTQSSDQQYLADVGFGGSLLTPLPLEDCAETHAPYSVSLVQMRDGWFRFTERTEGDEPFSFDFPPLPADEQTLSDKCVDLQTSPESSFVKNLVAQKRTPTAHWSLRGRVLKVYQQDGVARRELESVEQLLETLKAVFGIDVPEIADLWPAILWRHEENIS